MKDQARLDALLKLKRETGLSLDWWDERTRHLSDRDLIKLAESPEISPSNR